MEINLKPIHAQFKKELQAYIKEIAERHGINPLQALERFIEAVFADDDCWVEQMGLKLHQDYEINTETAYEFFEDFKSSVYDFICPNWNSTIENQSFNTYLNRRLKEEGYETIPFETLDFLYEEFQQTKVMEVDSGGI